MKSANVELSLGDYSLIYDALDFYLSSAIEFISYDEVIDLKIRVNKIQDKLEKSFEK